MPRKRSIAAIVILVVGGCVVVAGVGFAVASRTVPGVARMLHGDPAATEAAAAVSGPLPVLELDIATLTPTPSPLPSLTPTAAATALPTDTPPPTETPPAATASALPTEALPTGTATPSPTATASPAPLPTRAPTSTPAPTATPRLEWLAFETERGESGDYEVYAVAPDGSRATNLTNSWADDVAPVWAPGGKKIAFLSFRDTLAGKWGMGKGSIYVLPFDPAAGRAGEAVRVTDDGGNDDWPTWSPDGKRIAFQSDRGGNVDIWIVNLDGSGLVRLTASPSKDRYPSWSPDGRRIAYTSTASGNEDVWVVDVQQALGGAFDSGAVNLTNHPARDRYPMWSPDGSRLTFNSDRDGNNEVYMMNADGSGQRNISNAPETTEGLATWSPDGSALVLYSDRPGNKDVFIVNLDTGEWFNVTNNPASDEFCTWAP